MNTSPVLGTFAFAAAVTAVALGWRSLAPGPTVSSTRGEVPRLEYFASANSFSEVEQVRTQLQALARRCLYQVQIRQADALRARLPAGSPGGDTERTSITGLVQEFEERIREFQGTGEEPLLVRGLLLLLASDGAYERWLEVYLDFLYRRPTEELVGRLAREALTAGRATGRLAEVSAGLRHVVDIPVEFPGKREVRAALASAILAATPLRCEPTRNPGRPG
jgi:hypothetical protein